MYSEFKDKIVLITGGTSGIGKTTALSFAKYGAKVIICGRKEITDFKVVEEAQTKNLNIKFVSCDVSDHNAVKVMIENIVNEYGQLDFAFNNAGIDGDRNLLHEADIEDWHRMININLNGAFYCMKYQISAMLDSGGGVIVNNSSVSGHRGYPTLPGYIASKHGLIGLTKSAATGYADQNIRVNSISPGLIQTPIFPKETIDDEKFQNWVKQVVPMKRMANSIEVANTVLWLCSSQSSYITGTDIAVDGGILAK